MLKKIFSILGLIILIPIGLVGLLLLIMGMVEGMISMLICGIIITSLSVLGCIYCGKGVPKVNEAQRNIGDINESSKLTYSQKVLQNKEKMYRKMKYKFTFVSGLPLMQGALCKVISTYDKIVIDSQGTSFELAKEKITSITIEKNITNHIQAVSSAGRAIAGAMAFGVIGAAIGGRTMSKNIKTKKYYLVITYFDSEENVKYIVFDNSSKAQYLVEDFKTFHRDNLVKKVVEIN